MRAAVDYGEADQGDVKKETVVGNACGGKLGSPGSKAIPLSHTEGWSHRHSLSLPTHQHGSKTTESLAHQTPDTLNNRQGPHPGCPFKCLMHQSTE